MLAIKVNCLNDEASVVKAENVSFLDFCEAQIGGFPEFVHPARLPRPYAIVVDEIGLYKQLPMNPFGSWLYQTDVHGHPIVGDLMIVKDVMTCSGPDISGLDESDVPYLKKVLADFGIECAEEDGNHDER